MGISPHVAEIIVREHAFRPFDGKIVLLGHQTMLFTPQEAVELIKSCGVTPVAIETRDLGIDHSTYLSEEGQRGYIRDIDFFGLLGVKNIVALDHSDYEGAELIWNLNLPIPDEMEGIADVIIDGSTIDNVFDPACTLRNISRLLRPNGRLISTALGSNHYAPYMVPSPQWLFDYFVYNKYADAKVYYLVYAYSGLNIFTLDYDTQWRTTPSTETLHCPYTVGIVTIAEKGEDSTSNVNPSQHHYRPDAEWNLFESNMRPFRISKRPFHIKSRSDRDAAIPSLRGFSFVGPEVSLDIVKDEAMVPASELRLAQLEIQELRRLLGK